MLEIKTITNRLTNATDFDGAVNRAIADGWELVERRVLQPLAQPNTDTEYMNTMLYAELEKGREPVIKEAPKADLGDVCEVLVRLFGAQATCWEADARVVESSEQEAPEEEVTPEEERYCGNCKHDSPFGPKTQCELCYNADRWEPKE